MHAIGPSEVLYSTTNLITSNLTFSPTPPPPPSPFPPLFSFHCMNPSKCHCVCLSLPLYTSVGYFTYLFPNVNLLCPTSWMLTCLSSVRQYNSISRLICLCVCRSFCPSDISFMVLVSPYSFYFLSRAHYLLLLFLRFVHLLLHESIVIVTVVAISEFLERHSKPKRTSLFTRGSPW